VVEPEFTPAQQTVIAAQQRFYDAHENRDIDAMDQVWEHSGAVACTHPGWPTLHGWNAVRESWRQIFVGPGRNQFICTNISVRVEGDVAWSTLDENLVQGASTGTVAATNVFVRRGDAWKMVNHHGSPVMGG